MSFRVFAYGVGHFRYENNNCIDGDDFVPMQVVSTLMTMELSAPGAANAVIDVATAGGTPGETLATRAFLQTLNDAICFLAMCSDASNGSIAVSCTNSHFLRPDTSTFACYSLSGENPGAEEFIRRIGPGLSETSMNNWGVLRALSIVLSNYSSHIGQNARPYITISLRR